MTRHLRYLDAARGDLVDIAVYIAEQSSTATAREFIDGLRDRCRRLAALPGILGTARPELGDDIRSTPCRGYVIFFRYRSDTLEIISVLHGSRDVDAYFAG
jgi:toxin ParE1/3/4